MGVFKEPFNKLPNKPADPRQNVDWNACNEDSFNSMSWKECEKNILAGGYEKGKAKPNSNHGRIDDIERCNLDVKRMDENLEEVVKAENCKVLWMKDPSGNGPAEQLVRPAASRGESS